MRKLCSAVFGLPRTLWFNFRYLPLKQAVHLPIVLAANVRIRHMKRSGIVLASERSRKRFAIHVGFHSVEPIDEYSQHTILSVSGARGELIFNGTAHIGRGAIIHVAGGRLSLGNNFAVSGTTSIVCKNSITIGNDVQLSYKGLIIDNDAHKIYDESGQLIINTAPIVIGDNVWVAPNVNIMKGAVIPDNTVVASTGLVNKPFYEKNSIIGGIPAKKLKTIGSWRV